MEIALPLETDRLLIRPLGAGRNGWEVVERASGRIVGDAALSSGPELVLRVTDA